MKKFLNITGSLLIMLLLLATGCSGDEPGKNVPSDLVGSWVIQHTSRISTTYTFSSNGTGSFTFRGNTSYYTFPYTFSVSGKKVKIKGTYVNDDGDVDPNWHKEGTFSGGVLTINGDKLTKQ